MRLKESIDSMRDVTAIFTGAAKLLIVDAMDWVDQKLCDKNSVGGDDDQN
jgi:hypothetical protein